ncbi:uncharacterized protein LOC117648394, partial [Thrips palmi]|uniref:Uncharacterized protein LOC117648394 n=1 Tax=Thrips palmi TaxID=161013 RepID=A0A6P8Z2S7_THRPL
GLDVGRLQDIVATRVLPQCPRLTARPKHMPFAAGGGMCWVPDSDFAIERHVFLADCGGDGLQVYVSQLLDEKLPDDRPPWELRLLPACGSRKTEVVLVVRVHPALADGDALVRLLCHALADNATARPKQADDDGAAAVSVSWSSGIALSKVRRIQQVSRCSLNCVLLSAVGGAVRVLLQGCGVRQPPDLQVALPLSMHRSKGHDPAGQNGAPLPDHPPLLHLHHHHHLPSESSLYAYIDGLSNAVSANTNNNSHKVRDNNNPEGCAVSNKTAPVVVGLPVSVEGAVPRLWATRRCLQYLRSAADPEVVYLASLGGSWSGKLLAALTDKASLQFATLPGPASTVLVGGAVLKAVYPLQPAPGRLGIAVSVITYADQVFVTVASDAALGPAGSLLLQHFNVQIELLWRLLRNRRAPGETRPPLSLLRRADVQASPVGELASRLCYVQGELERLASEEAVDGHFDCGQEAARLSSLSSLKAEFTTLLHEVRKRQLQADEDGDVGVQARSSRRHRGRRMTSSPEQEYDAIAEAYYPAELKNCAKFSLLEESPTAEAASVASEQRRPSCLKKTTRRDTPPSDQSSPSLSTSVLHQLR